MVYKDDHVIHCYIVQKTGAFRGYISFIYASNQMGERQRMWLKLQEMSNIINEPWLLLGEFNVVLNVSEKLREDGNVGGVGTELEDFFVAANV